MDLMPVCPSAPSPRSGCAQAAPTTAAARQPRAVVPPPRAARWWALVALGLVVAGCSGGGGSPAPATSPAPQPSPPSPPPPAVNELKVGVKLAGFPHPVDIYAPAGATRALVVLHGGSGRNYLIANSLGINLTTDPPTSTAVNWTWLAAQKLIAVFPQGQTIPEAPSSFTWNNHAMVSGQDDQAFLVALAAYTRSTYGVSKVAVAGHSMGGTMVNRMWCQSPTTFDAHIALAGPASAYFLGVGTACQPSTPAPYMGIIGSSDTIMQTGAGWDVPTWVISPLVSKTAAFVNDTVVAEWAQHQRRAGLRCAQSPLLADKQVSGQVETWSHCNGSIVVRQVLNADHGINSLEARAGKSMVDYIVEFMGAP
jgi:polyhydroxybutyrate depolymerase